MPTLGERLTRRSWRRAVAAEFVDRLDREGELFFVGSGYEDREEMLRIAQLLPSDVVAELYEDPAYPGYTFMEVRLIDAPYAYDDGYDDQWEADRHAM
jgi:hypothetical protein